MEPFTTSRRAGLCLSLLLGAGLLASACSTNSPPTASRSAPAQPPGTSSGSLSQSAPAPTAAAAGSARNEAAADTAAKSAAPAAVAQGGQPGQPGQPAQPPAGQFDQRLILYNADLRLSVEDVPKTVQSLTQIATSTCGANGVCGFVSESNLRFENDRQLGTVKIQVPSDRYGEALNSVRGLGQKILSETSKSQDVTEEFTDQQSELRNLRASEERYLTLLRDAKSVQDILLLEDRLRQIRSQIERIQGRINYLQNRAALATISVELIPVGAAAASSQVLPEPVVAAQRAWNASLRFLSGAASVVVTIVVFFWWAIPFVLAAIIAGRVWFGRRRRAAVA
jgi:hypothetical protein